jgi:hypothetical protein
MQVRSLGNKVSGNSVWRSTTVHDRAGPVFCKRMERARTDQRAEVEQGASECDDMRGLATAVRMLAEDRGCRRVMVPVGLQSVEQSGRRFADAMMGLPLGVRSKILVELRVIGDRLPKACVEFAQALQMQASVSVATWVRCDRTEFVTEVIEQLSPAILGIEAKCLEWAMSTGNRSCYIDAVEAASLGGAMVLAAGVDSQRDLLSMTEIGVDLVYGRWWQKVTYAEEPKGHGAPALPEQHERRRTARGWPDAFA